MLVIRGQLRSSSDKTNKLCDVTLALQSQERMRSNSTDRSNRLFSASRNQKRQYWEVPPRPH
eukprot:1123612-Pyramimonas_sp.AAC.1